MTKLQPLRCENCGGLIDRSTMVCQMCGTAYKFDYEETDPKPIRISSFEHRMEVRKGVVLVPEQYMNVDPEKCMEFVVREMAKQMAEKLLPFIEYRQEYHPRTCEYEIQGRLMVADMRSPATQYTHFDFGGE